MMPHTSDDNYRTEILDAARQLMVQDGYKNLSMRKIARELNCSQGTIYLYFKNKDAIFYALIDEGTEQLYNAYKAVLQQPATPLAHLERICRVYVEFGLQNPSYYEIMYILLPILTERIPREQYRRARRFLDLTADTLQTVAEDRGITLESPFLEATVLWAAIHGMVALILAQRVDTSLNQTTLINQAIHRAISGFLNDSDEALNIEC